MPKTIHGMSHTRLYRIRNSMQQRCENPKSISYKRYGARGITLCEEWRQSFQAFYAWAMSHGYADNLTIERIDNDGNYCPENCRWATVKEQQNHTSYNRLITYHGETHNVTQWAEILGIPRTALYNRIRRSWDIEKALTPKLLKERGI